MLDDEALQSIIDDWSKGVKHPPESVPRALANQCIIVPEVVTVIQHRFSQTRKWAFSNPNGF